MDLFVINRYRDSPEDVDLINQETKHLEKLQKIIEERKKTFVNAKKLNVITLKQPIDNTPVIEIDGLKKNDKDEFKNKDDAIVVSDQLLEHNNLNSITKNPLTDFKVLGIDAFEKKKKVFRILPYWLSHPRVISTDLQNLSCLVAEQSWMHTTLKTNLLNEGIQLLFPVQQEVIPYILGEHKSSLQPRDICVSAPTGSGKTLAFVLPIIQILMNDVGHHIRALVVLPVQELAAQVAKVFKKYCTKTRLKIALLGGSTPLLQEQQQIVRYTQSLGWISEVDIIVCTAGRLVEHIQNTDGFSLKHLKFLVIDEADKIMDNIQNDWLYHVDRHIKVGNGLMSGRLSNLTWNNLSREETCPHKLLFSATLSQDPEKLEQWGLFQPILFSAASVSDNDDNEDQIRKYATPQELSEEFVSCSAENKPLILYYFLVIQKWNRVLCFTNSSQSAHRLAILLNIWGEEKLKVADLSSALDKTARESVIKKFTQADINVLISTDALARGIDIPDCNYVISYDPPRNIKTYIHRVGRTGRAGRKGHAVTILRHDQVSLFKDIFQSGGKADMPQIDIPTESLNHLKPSYENAIQQMKTTISSEIANKIQKSIKLKRGFKPLKRKRNT